MAHLEIKRGDTIVRTPLDKAAASIGRLTDNRVAVNDPDISRRHCLVEKWEGGYRVQDLGSRNGTRVNGKLVQQHLLAHGDLIRLGTTEIRFINDENASPMAHGRHRPFNRRAVLWSGIAIGCVAALVLVDWTGGWLGGFLTFDRLDTTFAGESEEASSNPHAADEYPRDPYQLISSDTIQALTATHINRPVRARFFGTPVIAPDRSLSWELPPKGELIALIEPNNAVHEALSKETMLMEAELFGILQKRTDRSGLWLQVGEIHLIGAYSGRDEDLQVATRKLLGKRVIVNPRHTASPESGSR